MLDDLMCVEKSALKSHQMSKLDTLESVVCAANVDHFQKVQTITAAP